MSVESTIKCNDDSRVFVDAWDDGSVWMNVSVHGANTRVIMSAAQTQKLIYALNRILQKDLLETEAV